MNSAKILILPNGKIIKDPCNGLGLVLQNGKVVKDPYNGYGLVLPNGKIVDRRRMI
jgi:hypothetical protein